MIAFCKNKFHILILFCSFNDLNFEYALKMKLAKYYYNIQLSINKKYDII